MKRCNFLSYAFFFLTSLSIVEVSAQQDTAKLMDEVIVTATRKSEYSRDLPYAVVSLNKTTTSNRLSRTLPESLTGLAGIYIQKTNHGGGSPFVRGLTGNQTLLMVDGIRLNNSIFRYGPNQYLTLIDNLIVDKVEVVKGSGSVQYGSDALTGVINVITSVPQFKEKSTWMGELTSRFTGFGMEKTVRPALSFSSKKIAFIAGVSNKQFGDLRGGDTTGFQSPSGYKELAWDAKLRWNLGKGWDLTAASQQLSQSNVPVYHKYILENFAINNSDPLKRAFSYITIKKNFESNFVKSLTSYVSSQNISEHRNSRKNGNQILKLEDDQAETISSGVDFLTNQTSYWSANSGIEFNADRIVSKRVDKDINIGTSSSKRGLYPDGATYNNAAFYSLHHFRFNKFMIEAGGRFNAYSIGISDTTLGKVNLSPSALVFQTGISYKLSAPLNVYVNISSGYRAPNIDDMGTLGIVDFRYEIPAYDLKPERSLNYEAGLKWNVLKFSGAASFFNTSLSNLITRVRSGAVMNGYDVYKKINVEKGFIQGFEFQSSFKATKAFNASFNLTSLYGQSITKNEPLRRIPPMNGQIGIQYQQEALKFGFIGDIAASQHRLAQGDKDDNRIQKGGTPGYQVYHFYSSMEINSLLLKIYFNNIFNQDYRTHGSGINGMGRSISMLATLKLGH